MNIPSETSLRLNIIVESSLSVPRRLAANCGAEAKSIVQLGRTFGNSPVVRGTDVTSVILLRGGRPACAPRIPGAMTSLRHKDEKSLDHLVGAYTLTHRLIFQRL